jgi:hypothetical protein
MKKVFALLAIAGFVACNSAETKDASSDSARIADSTRKADSTAAAAAAATQDTTHKDTSAHAGADTLKAAH